MTFTPEFWDNVKVAGTAVTATAALLKYTGKLKDWTGQKISIWIGEEIDARFHTHQKAIEAIVESKINETIQSPRFARIIKHTLDESLSSDIKPNGSTHL